jgi:glycosyltransferase involved in cell wall biosynthesis
MIIKKIKITTIVKDASEKGGGILAVAMPLHKFLQKVGINSTFVCSGEPCETITKFWTSGRFGILTFFLPKKAIGHVVHIHGIWTPFEFFSTLAAKLRGAKVIISPHGALEPWAFKSKNRKKRIAWWLYQKRLLQSADMLIINSQQEFVCLRKLGLTRPMAIIPNGVVLDGYNRSLAIKVERPKVILYFSRLDKKKGIELLLESWQKITEKRGYKLHIQGYGNSYYKQHLMELATYLKISEDVEFIEPLYGENRWSSFYNASIYILPSYSENFGITVAEALFSGLPAITTSEMPWHDLPQHGIGWSVSNVVPDIVKALDEAINLESEQLNAMREKAISYAESRFLWEDIVEQYATVYKWILDPTRENVPSCISI